MMKWIRKLAAVLSTTKEIIRYLGPLKTLRMMVKLSRYSATGLPRSLLVEAASKCNLECAMCWAYKASASRKNHFLDYSSYTKLVDEVSPFCAMIFFSFCGEPLLNPHLCDMIQYARAKGIIVGLSTNAITLTPQKIVDLIDAMPYEMVISIDSPSRESYELMRVGGNFDRLLENARALIAEKRRRGMSYPKIIFQMILTQKNQHQVHEFIELANNVGADRVTIKSLFIDHHGDRVYIERLLNEFLIDHTVSRYVKIGRVAVLKKLGPCPNFRSPVISSDGDVYICCFDIYGEYRKGNVVSDGFCRTWKSPEYAQFREKVMNTRSLPICRSCAYSDIPEISISLSGKKHVSSEYLHT
jgi:radical SAM protein with 4Fe4S-binding SPASM domain